MVTRKMGCYDFGHALLEANDLDPVYALVVNTDQDVWQDYKLEEWLLAYWCFYHVGTASWAASAPDHESYWGRMHEAAGSKDYPRSSERRHFRAANALQSVEYLRGVGIVDLFGYFQSRESLNAADVMSHVRSWRGFGPWIAFKVADMLERIGYVDVQFSMTDVMYDSPEKAAMMLWEHEGRPDAGLISRGPWAVGRILKEMRLIDGSLPYAPPAGPRLLDFQEAETILCKWKSYVGGHYHVGEDVQACRKGLLRFTRSYLSQRMYAGGRRAGLWS